MKSQDPLNQGLHPLLSILLEKERITKEQAKLLQKSYDSTKTPLTTLISKLGFFSEEELLQLVETEKKLVSFDFRNTTTSTLNSTTSEPSLPILKSTPILKSSNPGGQKTKTSPATTAIRKSPGANTSGIYKSSRVSAGPQKTSALTSGTRRGLTQKKKKTKPTKSRIVTSAGIRKSPIGSSTGAHKTRSTSVIRKNPGANTSGIYKPTGPATSGIHKSPKVATTGVHKTQKKNTSVVHNTPVSNTPSGFSNTPLGINASGTRKGIVSKKKTRMNLIGVTFIITITISFLFFVVSPFIFPKVKKQDKEISIDFKDSEKSIVFNDKSEPSLLGNPLRRNKKIWDKKELILSLRQQWKSLEIQEYQLLGKTRQGQFEQNLALLLKAFALWEEFLKNKNTEEILLETGYFEKVNERVKQIENYISTEDREKVAYLNAKKRKRELLENSKAQSLEEKEKQQELEREFKLMLSLLDKKKEEAQKMLVKKDFKTAVAIYKSSIYELFATYKPTFSEIEPYNIKLELLERQIAKELKKIQAKVPVEKKTKTLALEHKELIARFPNAMIKEPTKNEGYTIHYSFKKEEESDDFKGVTTRALSSGQVIQKTNTKEQGLFFKGLIELESKCFFSEFTMKVKLPILAEAEIGILFNLQRAENGKEEYYGLFVRPQKKSISFLKYSSSEEERQPHYLAQSIPLSYYLDKSNQIELYIRSNKLMLKPKRGRSKKMVEFSLPIQIPTHIGFFSPGRFKIEKLEIIETKNE